MSTLTIRKSDATNDVVGVLAHEHTADGGSTAPTFVIANVPDDAVELALICHDPDAPRPRGWTHWVVYGIPPAATEIGPSSEFRTGPNSSGDAFYFGCRPPAGHGVHHYFFHLYALDTPVEGSPSREEFLDRYASHIIGQARWVGLYEHPSE